MSLKVVKTDVLHVFYPLPNGSLTRFERNVPESVSRVLELLECSVPFWSTLPHCPAFVLLRAMRLNAELWSLKKKRTW